MKKVAILPTLLTLGNAICGFSAIIWAGKIDGTEATEPLFALAGWLILGAMFFDALDGYVARVSRTTSRFGAELDSLCDAISFGAAPAYLLLRLGPAWDRGALVHQLLVGIALLYVSCALLRLARFNVENAAGDSGGKKFRGLPSPGAAGCLASLGILRGGQTIAGLSPANQALAVGSIEAVATLGALAVALLMVSRVPYPHLTKRILRGRRQFTHVVEVVAAGLVIWITRELALVCLFWVYGLGIAVRHTWLRRRRPEALAAALGGYEDGAPR